MGGEVTCTALRFCTCKNMEIYGQFDIVLFCQVGYTVELCFYRGRRCVAWRRSLAAFPDCVAALLLFGGGVGNNIFPVCDRSFTFSHL